MTQLIHSPYFWFDTVGLLAQAIALWFAASKVQKSDWPFSLSFVITCILSLYALVWPVFSPDQADILRQCLHTSTAISFVMMAVLVSRDYKERAGADSWNLNWKIVAGGFLLLTLMASATVPVAFSMGKLFDKRSESQLRDIQNKAATAAGVGITTANLAELNNNLALENKESIREILTEIKMLMKLVALIPELRTEIDRLNMEVKRLRIETARRSTVIYLPERYKSKPDATTIPRTVLPIR